MTDENPAAEADLDLFGNPVMPLRDRRGRPSFAQSKENMDFVAVRAAAGWSHKMIADAIGCDEKTLRKHFSRELHGGALIVEGMCLDVLMAKVRQGHTPSVARLMERVDKAAPAAATPPSKDDDDAPKGVKERRLEEAANPDAEYGALYSRIARPQ
ncbi:hypothetical protein LX81_00271 [Palleronia aestuarii]|uniref:Homeodomain-like domain-containing protein n=1 Tax=Palleronia aestuarii TaxID=568105 RepID=A0A2W7NHS6_9RHOB|nr:hypothetical protein [Palleronia aestuarii]PZX19808.1 hypothetical protein LX81_00271 [Palleronia aestuarii]